MRTLIAIRDEAAKMRGYKAGQSAADFRKANPAGAARLAELLEIHKDAIVREMSDALQKGGAK